MDTGAPEPALVSDGDRLWVCYRCRDDRDEWDGQGEPPRDEPYGVLSFTGVVDHTLGPPSDEKLNEHPLYGKGLDFYAAHEALDTDRLKAAGAGTRHWIVTFHDETLEVLARGVAAEPAPIFSERHIPSEALAEFLASRRE